MAHFEHIPLENVQDLRGPQQVRVPIGGIVRGGADIIPHTEVELGTDVGEIHSFEVPEDKKVVVSSKWEALKVERNALTGLFIQEVWSETAALRQQIAEQGRASGHYSGVGTISWGRNYSEHTLVPLELEPSRGNVDTLRQATEATFRESASTWERKRQERLRTLPADELTRMDAAYRRFTDIINYGDHNWITRNESPAGFIDRGVATASETVWGLFGVTPVVFEEQFGRAPTRAELTSLLESTQALTVHLAAGNIDLAVGFLNFLRGQDEYTRHTSSSSNFNSQYFAIEDDRLTVRPEALDAYAATLDHEQTERNETTLTNMRTITTGCPAIAAMGQGTENSRAKNVVVEMHQWCMDIAREYYVGAFPEDNQAAPAEELVQVSTPQGDQLARLATQPKEQAVVAPSRLARIRAMLGWLWR